MFESIFSCDRTPPGTAIAIDFELSLGSFLGLRLRVEKYLKLPATAAQKAHISIGIGAFTKSAAANIFARGQALKNCPLP
ncbi:MAG: hypothetical protein V7K26_03600 [Nostoc sp.]|uniref:hypothetical protein n=1 Tax=Nostoc sp. TaxID=1180 RepID=UPI002FEF7849